MKKVLFVLICFFIGINVSYAEDVIFKECKQSKEFVKWDKLSKKKKNELASPTLCELNLNINNYLKGSASDSYFNLANQGKITSVKHQEDTNTCWAFSALSSVESNLLMNNGPTLDLSEAHLELAYQQNFQMGYPTYNRIIGQGGNGFIASSYFLNGRGPVLETSYPFSKLLAVRSDRNNFNLDEYKEVKPHLNIGSAYVYNGSNSSNSSKQCSISDINKIKSLLVEYGAVTSGLYMSSEYVDDTSGAYHYSGTLTPNHAVTIVGWNDEYIFNDKNLKEKPQSKGAWIVKNSYGASKYDKGYNYISYETKNICSTINWFDDINVIDQSKNYNTYYYDELFYNGGIQSTSSSVYLGSIYDKKSDKIEKLKQVKFASYIPGYSYKIYFADNNKFTNLILLASGTVKEAGYTNVNITKDINITSSKYSVVVFLKNEANNSGLYVPVIAKRTDDPTYSNIDIESGVNYVGYYSSPALWSDITISNQAMLAIKAVTEVTNQSEVIEPPQEDPIVPDEPIIPDEPVIPDEPEDNDKPTYDDGEKEEPNSSNNSVIIKPNEDNDKPFIEKTPESVENPKTSDMNGFLIALFIIMIIGILGFGIKKIKHYNKM